jgi:hypothetical protein
MWLHHHPDVEALQPDEPPLIYRKLANFNDANLPPSFFQHVLRAGYVPGAGPDRTYPASISVSELLLFERDRHGNSTNEHIENDFMMVLEARLREAFPASPILPVPVLFDAIPDLKAWRDGRRDEATSAFTPNLVNFQQLDDQLLIPRPYGPRVRTSDVPQLLREVMDAIPATRSLARFVDDRLVRRARLDQTVVWVKRDTGVSVPMPPLGTVLPVIVGLENLDHVVEYFRDGFPEDMSKDEIRGRILEKNRRQFLSTGELRAGWRRLVIPEETVDVFEAYMTVVARALGITLHWVDSWFYHVRLGELHCGTNVLRTAPGRKSVPWWNISTVIKFEENEAVGAE